MAVQLESFRFRRLFFPAPSQPSSHPVAFPDRRHIYKLVDITLLCQFGIVWTTGLESVLYKQSIHKLYLYYIDKDVFCLRVITPLQQVMSPICHHVFRRWSTCKRCAIHAYARARLRSCHDLQLSIQDLCWIHFLLGCPRRLLVSVHVACVKEGMCCFDGPFLPVPKKKGSVWNDYHSGSSAVQTLTVKHDDMARC